MIPQTTSKVNNTKGLVMKLWDTIPTSYLEIVSYELFGKEFKELSANESLKVTEVINEELRS